MRTGILLLVCLPLYGCGTRHVAIATYLAQPDARCGLAGPANLALGPSADVLDEAAAFTERGCGPAIEIGYKLEDTSFYSDIQIENQYTYGRFGGYARYAESARAVTLVR